MNPSYKNKHGRLVRLVHILISKDKDNINIYCIKCISSTSREFQKNKYLHDPVFNSRPDPNPIFKIRSDPDPHLYIRLVPV